MPVQLPQFTVAEVDVDVYVVPLLLENLGKIVPVGQIVKPLLSVVHPQVVEALYINQ